jgi:hypothetical protein
MIFTIIQILEKQNQFPDIEKLMSDWLKRLSKVLLVTDKFTVQIKQGYKEAKELWKNDYCRILKKGDRYSHPLIFLLGFLLDLENRNIN